MQQRDFVYTEIRELDDCFGGDSSYERGDNYVSVSPCFIYPLSDGFALVTCIDRIQFFSKLSELIDEFNER